jgi:hypothetical protein
MFGPQMKPEGNEENCIKRGLHNSNSSAIIVGTIK